MICRMNSGRKIKDKLSHLLNRWLFLKKQGTDDYLLTNELFIGHAGVLVPTKDKKLLFVEKLSFSLPYQVLKFDNRKQLKNYLMGMYDTSWGQEEAKPFIMENTKTAL